MHVSILSARAVLCSCNHISPLSLNAPLPFPRTARRVGQIFIADVNKKPLKPSSYLNLLYVDYSGEKVRGFDAH